MKKTNISFKWKLFVLTLFLLTLMGCARENNNLTENQSAENHTSKNTSQMEESFMDTTEQIEEETVEPIIMDVDWSDYFEEINGSAVIYNPAEHSYQIYNQELASTRRSPCSTFKIISSLIALEKGIVEPDNSTRTWSGEIFWNEDWNKDIDFYSAFHASCVWYFREVVDEIGKDIMQDELKQLQYGNCDISLLISPKEQTEVMSRIFGDDTAYAEAARNQLKQAMLQSELDSSNISIYGKTGMGKSHGIVVDAWFTGFAETAGKRIYFCVYLGETADKNVSSTKAKEIAAEIVSAYLMSGNGQW